MDADGQLFEHILRYMRRGVLVLFHDNAKAYDESLYLAFFYEAKYYDIP